MKNGQPDLEQIKKELYDYTMLERRFQFVINLFGGSIGISKTNYTDDVYKAAFDKYVNDAIDEAIKDQNETKK